MARCTSCSAPLPPHGTLCAYCGTRNEVDLRGIHEYTVAAPETDRRCPRCAVVLQTIDVRAGGRFLIEQCPECYGLFFDPGELEALLENSVTNVFEVDYQRLTAIVEAQGDAPRPVRYSRCPVCGTIMNRLNFGSRSGVIVDRCKGHGVWLDGGELRQLLAWKKAGGQLLHEKLRGERAREAERERRKRAAQTRSPDPGAAWSRDEVGSDLDLGRLLFGLVGRLFR